MPPYTLPENLLAGFAARLAAHQPSRVTVISGPMPNQYPGCTAFQITGQSQQDVQREVDKIMADVDVRGGVAEFRHPARSREPEYFGRWQSRGYTRISQPIVEAAE